jgi:hypothetical protein
MRRLWQMYLLVLVLVFTTTVDIPFILIEFHDFVAAVIDKAA